jgi:alpha-glucosidase
LNEAFRAGDPPHKRFIPLYSADLAEVHDVVRGLRGVIDEFPGRLLIGEIYLPIERLVAYYGHDLGGAHLPFNFALLETPWNARAIANLIDRYEAALPPGGWPNWVLGNHDRPRIASRLGADQARVAAMLLLTLRGTPTIYYGDEIGMRQLPIPPRQVRDPFEKNVPGLGLGRDGARTPMQWDATRHAGFSKAEPWLPLAADYHSENVVNQRSDSTSMLNLYRRLIAARRASSALQVGSYQPIEATGDLLLFVRAGGQERMLITLNLGGEPISVAFRSGAFEGTVLISSFGDRDGEAVSNSIDLRPNEGCVILVAEGVDIPASLE